MYCVKKITDDLAWIGANDRRLAMFEGVYSVPNGVSYNSYLLMDEKTVIFDTVDKAVSKIFFENIKHVLNGRNLDYLVVQHMEPDHAATMAELVLRYPEVTIVCNQKIVQMIKQYFDFDIDSRVKIVAEGDTLCTGKHTYTFLMAPMVHWPEVMVTYDLTDQILFSADAFGTFGALNGHIFADEVNFARDYMDEARRYYTNIVGKYGQQVQALLTKASTVEIKMICPLHGFVWRKRLNDFIEKYQLWSTYTPEENAVMIAYASVYGNTENAAEILACKLADKGIHTVMFDASVTHASEIVAAAFRYSHLVFASTTYNAGIFVEMENLLHDIAAHNIQNRKIALIENGSWAPASGDLMKGILSKMDGTEFIENKFTVKSALKENQLAGLDALADSIAKSIGTKKSAVADNADGEINPAAMFKLSYGLFVVTVHDGEKDSGCIVNTVTQLTDSPKRITVAVNKANYTHDVIKNTGVFNVSVLTEDATFKQFQQFGFSSGRDTNKFADCAYYNRSDNGLRYVPENTNAFISAKVIDSIEYETHTLFIADVTEAQVLSDVPSVTYAYYFDHIKPKPQPSAAKKKGWVCKICGYIYEGEDLPADFVCPLCKHGADDFEPLS
ncbi:MAG: flavin reductase [Bacillota bacterium]|jgi:flavorubredoxin/flavin reductase (DIM6/NTAB) family NADH-FMN oxidoreductase RutF